MQRDFITETAEQLLKKNKGKMHENETLEILEDIVTFFDVGEGEDNKEEFETSQQHIEMKELFRGHVMRDQKQANFHYTKHADLNKIIVGNAVLFYNECWKY